MSKHNLIIYSLLLAAAPISVLADSSTTSAATVGMFSPPTAPSVGHRPGTPRDSYELQFNGLGFFIEKYTPFPGMTIARNARNVGIRDPDNNYQSAETFTTVCTYYQTLSIYLNEKSHVSINLISKRNIGVQRLN